MTASPAPGAPEVGGATPARLALGLLLAALALYLPTLSHPLVLDSKQVVLEDPGIRSLSNLPGVFNAPSLAEPSPGTDFAKPLPYYRPLSRALYALQYRVFGTRPAGYHATSVALNGLAVLLFFRLLVGLGLAPHAAALAAGLWAAHPIRVEAVAWVFGQSELLLAIATFGALGSLHRGRLWAVPLWSAGALLARETGILLPAVLVAWELAFGKPPRRRRLQVIAATGALAAAFLVARAAVVGGGPPLTSLRGAALAHTVATVGARLLKLLVWPDAKVAFYPYAPVEALSATVVISYLILAAVVVGLIVAWRRGLRWEAFWIAWIGLWLVLWANVGRFGDYLMNEKSLYLPAAGFAALLAGATRGRRHVAVALAALAVAWSGATLWRLDAWRDPIGFLERAVEFTPSSQALRLGLADELVRAGRFRDAVPVFENLLERPWTPPDIAASWSLNNLGNCRFELGDRIEAIRLWRQALEAHPGNLQALYNVALAAEIEGDPRSAATLYRRFLGRSPTAPANLEAHIAALEQAAAEASPP